ncbi:MAG: helix-turn-helix domain-containing protein [Actinomycetota bacterium]|nr:helix-turn-helix domain-containing protein [Actinomycetota bacterium]
MGIQLIAEVLNHAPAGLSASERLVLIVVAEAARDHTRLGWPSMQVLARRTGLSERAVRKVLARLADRGYELRVPAGTDRTGAPIFAHKGHATVYRLPRFAAKVEPQYPLPDPKGGPPVPPSAVPKAVLTGRKGGTGGSQRRYPSTALPSIPSRTVNPRVRDADKVAVVIEAVRDRTGKIITDELHAARVARQLLDGGTDVRDELAYIRGAIAKDSNPTRFLPTHTPPPWKG